MSDHIAAAAAYLATIDADQVDADALDALRNAEQHLLMHGKPVETTQPHPGAAEALPDGGDA